MILFFKEDNDGRSKKNFVMKKDFYSNNISLLMNFRNAILDDVCIINLCFNQINKAFIIYNRLDKSHNELTLKSINKRDTCKNECQLRMLKTVNLFTFTG